MGKSDSVSCSSSGPASPAEVPSASDFADYLERALAGLKILVVEDSPDNQILFSRFLSASSAIVEIACNGEEGLQLQGTQEFDLIVMDICMPVLDGYEATKQIRRRGYQGPIIALTANALPEEPARCFAAGCSQFLTKPIDRMTLVAAIVTAHRRNL